MVETLWATYHDKIFRYINSRIGDQERARDLTQDVFETIVAHEDQLGDIRHFDRWIYRIAKNQLIDHTRKKKEARLDRQDFVPAATARSSTAARSPRSRRPASDGPDAKPMRLQFYGEVPWLRMESDAPIV